MTPRSRRGFGLVSTAERRQADRFLADLLGIRSQWIAEAESGENWIPTPSFPPRTSSMTGTAFMATIAGDKAPGRPGPWQKREDAMVAELLAGNIPAWLKQWITVRVSKKDASPVVTVRVLPDYLCVGTDTDYRHLPLDQQSAQKVASAFGAILPTAKICHAIWRWTPWSHVISAIQLPTLRKKANKDFAQNSTAAYDASSLAIQEEMKSKGISPGELVAGHKKDVVLSARARASPEKISFHGFYLGKYPAEPCYEGGDPASCNPELPVVTHPEGQGHFSDYSQGVRLVHPQMNIDGALHLVADVLKDMKLCTLIAEGPIDPPRVPPPPPPKG